MNKILLIVAISLIVISCEKEKVEIDNQADFSKDYINQHNGKYYIEIPEVFEEAFIILALKDENTPTYFTEKRTNYYQSIISKFNLYKNHKIFTTLDFKYTDIFNYFSFSDNSYCYEFSNNSIVSSKVYRKIWNPDIFSNKIDLVSDFAKVSDFENFYSANQDYYKSQIQLYDSLVPIKQMWNWLEMQFDTKINSYKIIISPLMDGSNNSSSISNNGYIESLMFVPAYHKELQKLDTLYLQKLVCFLFTEIDNNYSCPLLNKYNMDINKSISNLSKWIDNSNFSNSYSSAYDLLNEYFTWSIFCIYFKENFPAQYYLKMRDFVENNTVNRGFKLFKSFNQELIDIYNQRQTSEKLKDLIPNILQWVNTIDKQK